MKYIINYYVHNNSHWHLEKEVADSFEGLIPMLTMIEYVDWMRLVSVVTTDWGNDED